MWDDLSNADEPILVSTTTVNRVNMVKSVSGLVNAVYLSFWLG